MPRDPVLVQTTSITECVMTPFALGDRSFFAGCTRRSSRQIRWLLLLVVAACERPSSSESIDRKASHQPAVNRQQMLPEQTAKTGDNDQIPTNVGSEGSPPLNPPVYRPYDQRIRHDEKRLAEVGIRVLESKRLRLYTDVSAEFVQTLPSLIDELFLAWESYFGPMPPDRAGSDFQMSGYLMKDVSRFRGLGLIPDGLTFAHGSNVQNEFWMYDQEFDYYRRHLLIHEATHCFMTFMPGVDAPRWYLEGMAEYFGSHRLPESADLSGASPSAPAMQFCVMPTSQQQFLGFGRILIIRKAASQNRMLMIPAVMDLKSSEFVSPEPYSWAWALCVFLDGTPKYHERFQRLSQFTRGNQFTREFVRAFALDERDLDTEWTLFLKNLQYGYNLKNAAIDFRKGALLTDTSSSQTVEIVADRGWQSSGVLVEVGSRYEVTGEGRFTLADGNSNQKPWVSEPQGISFQYFEGHPLGILMGCIRSEEGPVGGADETMLKAIPLGRRGSFEARVAGTLYLRLNDAWNSLSDNRGKIEVTIRRMDETR